MPETLRAVIIDDEPDCVRSLSRDLKENCPDVEVVGRCEGAKDGIKAINTQKPDVVFLDIDMPLINGFELLELLPDIDFSVVFTTAYDKYAMQAFKISAVDYLLKPVDPEELVKAVKKVRVLRGHTTNREQIHFLMQQIKDQENNTVHRIALPTSEGLDFIDLDDILYCESDGAYSYVRYTDGSSLLISKPLKYLEDILCDFQFFRVHKSYIVNMDYVAKYHRGSGGLLTMKNGARIKVSRSKKEELLSLF
ncbi:MAG: response regulator [Saprospiraceae bacterium]|nr:response regulator [Saprospiraceae bacterium]